MKVILKFFLRLILFLYFKLYKVLAILFIKIEGVHPKHSIIKYEDWFLSHLSQDDVVLDIGCKYGGMVNLMSKKAKFVYGIEINERDYSIAANSKSSLNVDFFLGDATSYNYDALCPVSIITLSNVLEHIDNRISFLQNLSRALNWANSNAKRVLIRVPSVERDWLPLAAKKYGIDSRLDSTHFTEYTKEQLISELSESNINIEQIHMAFGEFYVVGSFA